MTKIHLLLVSVYISMIIPFVNDSRDLSNVTDSNVVKLLENKEKAKVYYHTKWMPKSLKDVYKNWHGNRLKLANPKMPFRENDVIRIDNFYLPNKRLNILINLDNLWFVSYKHGGRGVHDHLAIFIIENDEMLYLKNYFIPRFDDENNFFLLLEQAEYEDYGFMNSE